MINLEVMIYLNTPLVQPDPKAKNLPEELHRIRGKILSEHATGYMLQVKAIGSSKEWVENPASLKRIFLPLHKVDFMVLE